MVLHSGCVVEVVHLLLTIVSTMVTFFQSLGPCVGGCVGVCGYPIQVFVVLLGSFGAGFGVSKSFIGQCLRWVVVSISKSSRSSGRLSLEWLCWSKSRPSGSSSSWEWRHCQGLVCWVTSIDILRLAAQRGVVAPRRGSLVLRPGFIPLGGALGCSVDPGGPRTSRQCGLRLRAFGQGTCLRKSSNAGPNSGGFCSWTLAEPSFRLEATKSTLSPPKLSKNLPIYESP